LTKIIVVYNGSVVFSIVLLMCFT